ncbi:AAA family ATPase [Paenibacillus rhizoplanae]
MLHRPRLLILDEPTNGLDPVSTTDLRKMLSRLAKEEGTTIIMTTHHLEEVQKLCDRITILRHGRNIFLPIPSQCSKTANITWRTGNSVLKSCIWIWIWSRGRTMNRSYPVVRMQCAEFTSDKGMLFFYGLSIGITGIIVPIFMHGVEVSLSLAALLTAILVRPMLSDSIAGEREHRTLETLLSSPIHGKKACSGGSLNSASFCAGLLHYYRPLLRVNELSCRRRSGVDSLAMDVHHDCSCIEL